jgi:hypothetical protein
MIRDMTVTKSIPAGHPASLTETTSPTDRFDSLGWGFVFAGLFVSILFGLLSDGLYMNDDATHYFIAREGFTDLENLLHRWGRVGYTLPTAPVAYWFGFTGCRIFSAVQTALLSFLAWRTARRLIGPGLAAATAALLVWIQPLTFLLSMTTLTETTGALYMLLAIFLYVRGNRLWSCVAFSALFLARDETMALGPMIVAAMLIDAYRQADGKTFRRAVGTWWVWVGGVLLLSGPVLYVLATIPVDLPPDGDPLQIFSRPYSAEYGTGPLYWMTARWCEQATPGIVALGITGAALLIRSLWRREPLNPTCPPPNGTWLVAAFPLAYAVMHSILYNRGMFAHGGEARYMVPIGGLTAVLGAIGLRGIVISRPRWAVQIFAILLAGLIWLPLLMFPFVLNSLPYLLRLGLVVFTVLLILVGIVPLVYRKIKLKPLAAAILAIAAVLAMGQLRFYFRPITLDKPMDPLDRLLATAVRYVEAENLAGRPVLGKHPLIRFLLPESQLRWSNDDALTQWREDPPGTIFIWDSKNCNWPDPKERETNALLMETLQSQAVLKQRYVETSSAYPQPMKVLVFEKTAAAKTPTGNATATAPSSCHSERSEAKSRNLTHSKP